MNEKPKDVRVESSVEVHLRFFFRKTIVCGGHVDAASRREEVRNLLSNIVKAILYAMRRRQR